MNHPLPSQMTLRRFAVGSAFALSFTALSSAYANVNCGTELVCPNNYKCVESAEEVCTPSTANCFTGENGTTTCEKTEEGTCSTETYYSCEPLPCTDNSVCSADMTCHSYTSEACSGGSAVACDSATGDCPVNNVTEECTTTEQSLCVPQWFIPCQVAADCGEGFTCEESSSCSCSGSAGTTGRDAASGGATSTDEGIGGGSSGATESCTCAGTGTFTCVAKTIACKKDIDCPTHWTCDGNPNGTCTSSPDGSTDCKADPAMVCTPPYANLFGNGGAARSEDSSIGVNEGGIAMVSDGKDDETNGTTSANPEATSGSVADNSTSSGCSLAGSQHGSERCGFVLFGLGLALATLGRRRSRT
jgi:hypothetical protein